MINVASMAGASRHAPSFAVNSCDPHDYPSTASIASTSAAATYYCAQQSRALYAMGPIKGEWPAAYPAVRSTVVRFPHHPTTENWKSNLGIGVAQ